MGKRNPEWIKKNHKLEKWTKNVQKVERKQKAI